MSALVCPITVFGARPRWTYARVLEWDVRAVSQNLQGRSSGPRGALEVMSLIISREAFAPTRSVFLSLLLSEDCGYIIVRQRRCIQQVLPLMCARRLFCAFSTVILRQSWLLRSISDNVTGAHRAPTELSISCQLNAASTPAASCKAHVCFRSFCICSFYFLISFIYFCFYHLSSLFQHGQKVLHVSMATCLQVRVCL